MAKKALPNSKPQKNPADAPGAATPPKKSAPKPKKVGGGY